MSAEYTVEEMALARQLMAVGQAAWAANPAWSNIRRFDFGELESHQQAGWLGIARWVLENFTRERVSADRCSVCEQAYSEENPRFLTPANQYICHECEIKWRRLMARGVSGAELLRQNAAKKGGAS
jgi:hypothetical protein